MNLGLDALPSRCDVLVIGAGPAGSAVAQQLARGGREVVLVDRHAFPRDKVCGDGLIPDALRALERLGVREAVLAEARHATALRCVAPRGGCLDVPGTLAVLPRKRLDAIVCAAAVAAGARMFAPLLFVGLRRDAAGRVVGATLQHGEARRDLEARWVVLATGAETPALIAAGVCERRAASGIALRGYVHHPAMAAQVDRLEVVWHRRLGRGYGWIFPCGDGVFNIGVGATLAPDPASARARRDKAPGLRDLFRTFTEVHVPAGALVAGGRWLGEPGQALKGAPLRCSLAGARLDGPGLLVVGEAAGSTYALTGEGIGKAMETGLHAADAILAGGDDDAAVRADYRARLAALKPRFAVYDDAHRAVDHPWLLDLLVWSAKRSPARLQRLAGVLDETYLPRDATSVRGVLRRLVGRR
jgi:geranylgeranyl reductase family protein